ncbi:hypothetical protein LTR94_035276, partial [Friedmanniomyces endolithicus]
AALEAAAEADRPRRAHEPVDAPRRGPIYPAQHSDQGRLALAVSPQDSHPPIPLQREVQPREQRPMRPVIGPGQVGDDQPDIGLDRQGGHQVCLCSRTPVQISQPMA